MYKLNAIYVNGFFIKMKKKINMTHYKPQPQIKASPYIEKASTKRATMVTVGMQINFSVNVYPYLFLALCFQSVQSEN